MLFGSQQNTEMNRLFLQRRWATSIACLCRGVEITIRLILLAAAFSLALFTHAFADEELAAGALLGRWQVTEQHPSGAKFRTLVELTSDMRFTTSSTVNGNPILAASGTWTLTGRSLEWHYQQSSHPSIPNGFVDRDDVKSVTPTAITLTSSLSGKTHTYQRVLEK